MMEAMQMSPSAYGPQMVGPGIGSVGGCVFDAQIGRGAYSRITKDNQKKAEQAMVVDAATAFSEQKGEIGHYKLLVRNVRYRDKITDEVISEKTLVSPDFNYEAAGVWTSAGENGTVGSIAEYRATVDRANELAQMEGDASMFWASPSTEGDVHRAYLWVKTGDEVEAFQYIVPGSKDAVSTMMKKLGYKDGDNKPLEDQTIIRLGNEPKIHHKDVYDAVVLSLSPNELNKAKPILDKFKKESELPDSIREKRLNSYKGEYEAKLNSEILKKAYESDIENWLKSVAQGFAAINRIDGTVRISETKVNDNRIVSDQLKIDKAAYFDYQRIEESKDKSDSEKSNSRVLQPMIPGILGLAGIIVNISIEQEKGNAQNMVDLKKDRLTINNEINNPNIGYGKILEIPTNDFDSSSESIFWQEFISVIFEPLPDLGSRENSKNDLMIIEGIAFQRVPRESMQTNDKAEFLDEERNFQDVLMQLLPISNKDKKNESEPSQNKEGLKVLTSGLQHGLEILAVIIKGKDNFEFKIDQKEEKTRQQKIETDVANIGEEIIVKMFKDVQIPQNDAFPQLAYLLFVYNDKNSSEEVKHLISAMIYKQVEIIIKDKSLISRFPQLATVVEKFRKLSSQAQFLEDRFEIILATLEKLYSKDSVFRNVKNDQDFFRKLVFLIVKIMHTSTGSEDYSEQNFHNLSIERLRLLNLTGNNIHYLFKYQNKKKIQTLAKNGIIFFNPTCFTESLYDKIERKG